MQPRLAQIAEIPDFELAERLQRAQRDDASLQAAEEREQQFVAVAALEDRTVQRLEAERKQCGAQSIRLLIQLSIGVFAFRPDQRQPVMMVLKRLAESANEGFSGQNAIRHVASQAFLLGIAHTVQQDGGAHMGGLQHCCLPLSLSLYGPMLLT